jgi:P27 family predicted phage terminase small subunit
MRGPKPRPTHLKLVKGARPARINKNEPKPPPGIPTPPPFLLPEAVEEWHSLAPALYQAGLLTPIDRAVFAAFCQSVGRWIQAEKALAEAGAGHGLLIASSSNNGYRIPHPLLHIANRAMADSVRYGAEFGLSPSSRSRVTAKPPPPDDTDPASEYFR